ncbi:winged helix-turn-helix domain-containing protein [Baekduia alba]|uniref:winged helix-turn-helix domain-containing protein n=1 Tax=Baekduia alba TaxID=2997333 RepID=UPI002340ED1B|nr:helix-turn-helix domain-containing protein [Baekduia alba]
MHTAQQKQARRASLRPHPVRDQIVDVMRSYGKPISPTQIARVTGGSLGSVAYHVRTLVAAGVIELAGEGRVRGAVEHFYALTADAAGTQLTDPVGALLVLCGALTVPGPEGQYPQPIALDDRAREELSAMIERLRPEVRAIASASTARAA